MLLDPDLFKSKLFRFGISQQMLQQIALGGLMIALPIYLQMVLEYNAMAAGLSLAPLSLSMFALALLAGFLAAAGRPLGMGLLVLFVLGLYLIAASMLLEAGVILDLVLPPAAMLLAFAVALPLASSWNTPVLKRPNR